MTGGSRLAGKVVILTGATGGIGTATARRLATPQDVAAAIAYLASDDATHVTGATLAVDGGYTAA